MFRQNALKAKLAAGGVAHGVINATGAPLVAEMLGLAGYDFVLVDGEHGPSGHDGQLAQLLALQTTRATPLVRIAEWGHAHVKRVLDIGFEGVMIPAIPDAVAARDAVAACRYPPRGTRGAAAGIARAANYGMSAPRYLREAEGELFTCVMIETARAVDEVAEIAAIDGLDSIQIGPFDLAGDLGCAPSFDDPAFRAAIDRIEAAVIPSGKTLGGLALPGRNRTDLIDRGYRMITCGSDVGFLRAAMLDNLTQIGYPPPE